MTEPLDPDFMDPNTVGPDELFIGRRSLAWLLPELLASSVFQATLEQGGEATVPPMEITLKEGFTVPYVKGFRRYSPRMQEAMELEIARQVSMGVIEPCDDAAVQEVVMVRKDDAPNGFRMTLDARAVNAGMVVEPCNPPPVKEMLHALGLESLWPSFEEEDITDINTALAMSDDEFKELGCKIGHRVKIKNWLTEYSYLAQISNNLLS